MSRAPAWTISRSPGRSATLVAMTGQPRSPPACSTSDSRATRSAPCGSRTVTRSTDRPPGPRAGGPPGRFERAAFRALWIAHDQAQHRPAGVAARLRADLEMDVRRNPDRQLDPTVRLELEGIPAVALDQRPPTGDRA